MGWTRVTSMHAPVEVTRPLRTTHASRLAVPSLSLIFSVPCCPPDHPRPFEEETVQVPFDIHPPLRTPPSSPRLLPPPHTSQPQLPTQTASPPLSVPSSNFMSATQLNPPPTRTRTLFKPPTLHTLLKKSKALSHAPSTQRERSKQARSPPFHIHIPYARPSLPLPTIPSPHNTTHPPLHSTPLHNPHTFPRLGRGKTLRNPVQRRQASHSIPFVPTSSPSLPSTGRLLSPSPPNRVVDETQRAFIVPFPPLHAAGEKTQEA